VRQKRWIFQRAYNYNIVTDNSNIVGYQARAMISYIAARAVFGYFNAQFCKQPTEYKYISKCGFMVFRKHRLVLQKNKKKSFT